MLFTSLEFIIFAAVFFPAYFALAGRARMLLVLAASYFFYGWWDVRFVSLLIFSSVVDYSIGLKIEAARGDRVWSRRWVTLSLVINLSILGFFKYFNFFLDSAYDLLGSANAGGQPLLEIILPVGISFYTFQTLSYSIDLYRGKIERAERDFIAFASYVALFPQLVAGPIVRASDLLPQLHEPHRLETARLARGFEIILWGFFLKLCLADTAATVVDPRFSEPNAYGSLAHMIGLWAFSMQIYGDFAGYSLIAIGLGYWMGLDFGVNFNRPFFAEGFSEFWERWHISLSTWLRDYLYIPLGGSRGGTLFTFRNLMLTMLLGGLWHGAGYTYLIWGALQGTYLVVQRLVSSSYARACELLRMPRWLIRCVSILVVFSFTCFGWAFFRAEKLDDSFTILKIIFSVDDMNLRMSQQLIGIAKTLLLSSIVFFVDWSSLSAKVRERYFASVPLRFAGALVILWAILLFGTFEGSSFLYFQF